MGVTATGLGISVFSCTPASAFLFQSLLDCLPLPTCLGIGFTCFGTLKAGCIQDGALFLTPSWKAGAFQAPTLVVWFGLIMLSLALVSLLHTACVSIHRLIAPNTLTTLLIADLTISFLLLSISITYLFI